eukprot:315824-Rhodomonas_salina.1
MSTFQDTVRACHGGRRSVTRERGRRSWRRRRRRCASRSGCSRPAAASAKHAPQRRPAPLRTRPAGARGGEAQRSGGASGGGRRASRPSFSGSRASPPALPLTPRSLPVYEPPCLPVHSLSLARAACVRITCTSRAHHGGSRALDARRPWGVRPGLLAP